MNYNKIKVAVWIGLILPLTLFPHQLIAKHHQPNLVIIVADHLGLQHLGCYGTTVIETPHIDALAQNGLRFTNHYAGQAVAVPSRYAMLSGLHMGHAYIRAIDEMDNRGEVWNYKAVLADSTLEGQRPLKENTNLIPQKLKAAGYVSACFGKWGLGYPGSAATPCKMGFDFFYGYNCERQAKTYYPPFLYRNEQRVYLNNQYVEPEQKFDRADDPYEAKFYERYALQDYAPDKIYAEICHFVQQHQQESFALFWMSPIPQAPLQAPERWVSYYREMFGEETPYLGKDGYQPCRYPKATYAAMVSYLDEQIGGLVQQLKDLGLYENTLILITSSNGTPVSLSDDADLKHPDDAWPFRSRTERGSLCEQDLRVPLIACWPKEIEPGGTSDLLSASWDMYPTLCEIADVEAGSNDGISMLPIMKGKKRKQKTHDYLYWEYPGADGQKAVRTKSWKAYLDNIYNGNSKIQLFDLTHDQEATTDVSSAHPEVIRRVEEIFATEHLTPEVKSFDLSKRQRHQN